MLVLLTLVAIMGTLIKIPSHSLLSWWKTLVINYCPLVSENEDLNGSS